MAARATKDDYGKATVFLNTLAKGLGIEKEKILIVPGNHDVDWTVLRKSYVRKYSRGFKPEECAKLSVKMSSFKKWFHDFYTYKPKSKKQTKKKKKPRYQYEARQPVFFDKISFPGIVVLGLDTCERNVYEPKRHKKSKTQASINYGYVGHNQLAKAEQLFSRYGQDRFKIVLMHHNPFPNTDEPLYKQSGLKNYEEVVVALKNMGVHLVLAGHMHRARFIIPHSLEESLDDKVTGLKTLLTGPCCLKFSERKFYIENNQYEILPNRYQVLMLDPSIGLCNLILRRFSFEKRSSDGSWGAWTGDTDLAYADERARKSFSLGVGGKVEIDWGKLTPQFQATINEAIKFN